MKIYHSILYVLWDQLIKCKFYDISYCKVYYETSYYNIYLIYDTNN